MAEPVIKAPVKANKLTFKLQHELETLPKRMEKLEAEKVELQKLLADASLYMKEPEKFDASSKRLAKIQSELETAEHRWLELEEMRESLS